MLLTVSGAGAPRTLTGINARPELTERGAKAADGTRAVADTPDDPQLWRMKTTDLGAAPGALPLIDLRLWERVARDFDDVGPDACISEIFDELLAHNPHYLEMALRSARDVGDPEGMFAGFAMFYRILSLGACERGSVLPRITPETRDAIAALAGECGDAQFVMLATDTLRAENPCLMQMADGFASRHEDYLGIMQAFALLYKSLSAQALINGLRSGAKRSGPEPEGRSAA